MTLLKENSTQAKAPSSESPALRLDRVSKVYVARSGQVVHAVAEFSLTLNVGEVVAVLGPSGCGKSSLLRILAGLDADFNGDIIWSSADENNASNRLHSATVFQGDSALPWMNVQQNVEIGLSGLHLNAAEIRKRTSKYLSLVGLSSCQKAYPHELSGGMRQRVAIARALATEPLLLLMDEPLSALDAQTRLVMQQELLDIWKRTKSSVIYVTHDISEAITLADRVVVMTRGPGRVKLIRDIPFGDQRNALDLRTRPEFGEIEVQLWRTVAEEVGSSLTGSAK